MKKIWSILLALCLVIGIGAGGAMGVGAEVEVSASGLEDLLTGLFLKDSLMEKVPYLMSFMAYGIVCQKESMKPASEAGLLPGKNLDDVRAGIEAESVDIDGDLENFLLNTSPQDMEQALARCDALFVENFTEDFLAEFNTFKKTALRVTEQYMKALSTLSAMASNGKILFLSADVRAEAVELFDWINGMSITDGLDEFETLAELTAHFSGIEERIAPTMKRIEADSAQKWWQRLPKVAQVLLRYLCFGWIWMK